MAKTNVLITGVTGFIGGAVLGRLLESSHRDSFNLTALVRSADKATILKDKFGVNTVVGSTADHEKLSQLVEASDVVFSITDADDMSLASAYLAGFKRRFEKTGTTGAIIHTSGTAVVFDDANGNRVNETVVSDTNLAQLDAINPAALHRNVDLAYINADKEGYVRTYIVSPGLVYGLASGPLVDAGIVNKHSIVVPAYLKQAVDRGQAGQFGKGVNQWANVGVYDLADLYVLIFTTLLTDPSKAGHGREGYYWGASDEHVALDIAKEIGRVLHKLGKVNTVETSGYTQDEINKYWGGFAAMGGNARVRADRSYALGWKPKASNKDMLASVEAEAKSVLGL